MRRLAVPLAMILLAALLLPTGCGGEAARDEVIELLARRSGEIDSVSYTCVTEDAGRIYREEFELAFPDHYRYRFYQYEGGMVRLQNLTTQSGTDLYRARVMQDSAGGTDYLQVETITAIPPLRCTGTYLALYHLVGNVDFFQSMLSLIKGGQLLAGGMEDRDGTSTYRLERLKAPRVGWNSLSFPRPTRLFEGVSEGAQVYFTHSYAAPVVNATAATTTHGTTFSAAVEAGVVSGVQFHPEKSGYVGLRILRNWLVGVRGSCVPAAAR